MSAWRIFRFWKWIAGALAVLGGLFALKANASAKRQAELARVKKDREAAERDAKALHAAATQAKVAAKYAADKEKDILLEIEKEKKANASEKADDAGAVNRVLDSARRTGKRRKFRQ